MQLQDPQEVLLPAGGGVASLDPYSRERKSFNTNSGFLPPNLPDEMVLTQRNAEEAALPTPEPLVTFRRERFILQEARRAATQKKAANYTHGVCGPSSSCSSKRFHIKPSEPPDEEVKIVVFTMWPTSEDERRKCRASAAPLAPRVSEATGGIRRPALRCLIYYV